MVKDALLDAPIAIMSTKGVNIWIIEAYVAVFAVAVRKTLQSLTYEPLFMDPQFFKRRESSKVLLPHEP